MSKIEVAPRTFLFVSSVSALYGAERSLLEIINVMSPAWRPWFVVPAKGTFSAALDKANYPYDVIPVPHGGRRFFLAALRLAWIMRRRRTTLVHANLHWTVPLVAIASRWTGVPFVAHFRNIISEPFDERKKKPFRDAAAAICISRAVKNAACEAGVFSPEQYDRIWIIPDSRNLSKYAHGKRAAIRAELGISEDVPLIGMIARIEPMKGQHIFLEAAALIADQMPTARFLLVGDGDWHRDYLAMLKRRCEDPRLKHRVTFLGYRTDVPDILAALDCFAHPSSRGAFVSVLIEAMAVGIPLVVSDVDGIPECVGRDGAAELIDNLEPSVWANAIVQIMRDPARRASMARAGRERAKRYDATRLARETEDVFAHCLVR
jgi:glycosyltransferase involved in cell wall biosynthesis